MIKMDSSDKKVNYSYRYTKKNHINNCPNLHNFEKNQNKIQKNVIIKKF